MLHDASSPGNPKIEQRSSAPNRAPGAYYANNKLEGQSLFIGKVDDTYPVSGCCMVSLYGLQTSVPALMLSTAMGNYFGARSVSLPSTGTEVLVYVGMDRKVGYIVGYVPTVSLQPMSEPAQQIVLEGGVNGYSEKEPFFQGDWQKGKKLPYAGGGSTVDALPGDDGAINDLGCFVGILRACAAFRGSELAKITAFAFDDVLEIVGHNLNVFTSQGEHRTFSDCGRVSSEEQLALTPSESLGAGSEGQDAFTDDSSASLRTNPTKSLIKSKADRQVGKWRWKSWSGWLGDFKQSFLCRPAGGVGSLNQANKSDMGLYSEAITTSGQHLERSILGGGLHKVLQIAVPKKIREFDDPEGDQDTKPVKKGPYLFHPNHPMGWGAQSRDFFAYLFSSYLQSNRLTLKKDWVTPDEASCPAPGSAPAVPGVGKFFRDFPKEAEIMADKDGVPDDTAHGSSKFRVGEGFIGLLPDGSIQLRNAWGDTMEMRAGHITFSASKDITATAGGSIVNLAGDDFIAKARKSLDLSTTEQQVRIKSGRDILVHAETGGVLVSTAEVKPDIKTDKQGEEVKLCGIVLKSNLGVAVTGKSVLIGATETIMLRDRPEAGGKLPRLLTNCVEQLHSVSQGQIIYKLRDDFVVLSEGTVIATKDVLTSGNVVATQSVTYGTSTGKADMKEMPDYKSLFKPVFTGSTFVINNFYTDAQLAQARFTFRNSKEYATEEGVWYASSWQTTLGTFDDWKEKEIAGTFPWPGEKAYKGNSYYYYIETNVAASGKPKARASMTNQAGHFAPANFHQLRVHRAR